MFEAYKKSGYSKKFYSEHEAELLIYKAAEEVYKSVPRGKKRCIGRSKAKKKKRVVINVPETHGLSLCCKSRKNAFVGQTHCSPQRHSVPTGLE